MKQYNYVANEVWLIYSDAIFAVFYYKFFDRWYICHYIFCRTHPTWGS